MGESSAASYTTSLSTDTLYWDSPCDTQGRRSSKSGATSNKVEYQQYPSTSSYQDAATQYAVSKPKSWDNLTTKAYGGYGFGYGYVDTTKQCTSKSHHGRTHSTKSTQGQYYRANNEKQIQTQHVYPTQRRYIHPTKSTESLLTVPKFNSGDATLSDSSLSCECLEAASPDVSEGAQFFPSSSTHQNMSSPTDSNSTYYSRRIPRPEHQRNNVVTTSSEITRL